MRLTRLKQLELLKSTLKHFGGEGDVETVNARRLTSNIDTVQECKDALSSRCRKGMNRGRIRRRERSRIVSYIGKIH